MEYIPIKPMEKTKKELLIEEVMKSIGTDASPLDWAKDEFGCAESVSAILNKIFPDFPKNIVSTVVLCDTLKTSPHFKGTLEPKTGCVIVSPRSSTKYGHAGFVVEDNRIVSNDSNTGKMQNNYSMHSWRTIFQGGRGLKTYLFEIIS